MIVVVVFVEHGCDDPGDLNVESNVLNLGLSGTVRTDMSPYGLVAMRSHDAQHGLCFFVTIYR